MTQLLHVDNISVAFDGFKAINGLRFDIARAELRAIIGPNGAGKTTTFYMLAGLIPADEGRVNLEGKNVNELQILKQTRMIKCQTYPS